MGLFLFAGGCRQSTDLDEVRKLADSASAAQVSYDAVVADFTASCDRRTAWTNAITIELSAHSHQTVDFSKLEPPCGLDPHNVAATMTWNDWDTLLLTYYVSLGLIAGRVPGADRFGLKAFATTLDSDKEVAKDPAISARVTVVSGLADKAITAMFSMRRQDDIAKYAAPGGPGTVFVLRITEQLSQNADLLLDNLKHERDELNRFYTQRLKIFPAAADPSNLPTVELRYQTDAAAVAAKIDAVAHYKSSLAALLKAHEAITESIGKNDPAAIKAIVNDLVSQFKPDLNALEKAFKEK